jgi:hypothetical protein
MNQKESQLVWVAVLFVLKDNIPFLVHCFRYTVNSKEKQNQTERGNHYE